MLTFLELYQTLLGFVFFKLYTDAGLVYPPPMDLKKDEGGAGVGAYSLQDVSHSTKPKLHSNVTGVGIGGRKVTGKDVRQTIKKITLDDPTFDTPNGTSETMEDIDEEFVAHPSTSGPHISETSLPTFQSLANLPQPLSLTLFAPYTFFLSRETSRPIFEFLVRSFGGKIGWHYSAGSGSPFEETDDAITHVIIDRPLVERLDESGEERQRRLRRKYVQPQWVVDCINAGRILLEDPYSPGKTLPPHLSPFGEEYAGAYDPMVDGNEGPIEAEVQSEGEDDAADIEDDAEELGKSALTTAITAITDDPDALRSAELAAEAAGVDYGTFEKEVRRSQKSSKKAEPMVDDAEKDMNKMMMSNKQRKLYEKMKHSQRKRENEVCISLYSSLSILMSSQRATLAAKKEKIQKQKKRTRMVQA